MEHMFNEDTGCDEVSGNFFLRGEQAECLCKTWRMQVFGVPQTLTRCFSGETLNYGGYYVYGKTERRDNSEMDIVASGSTLI